MTFEEAKKELKSYGYLLKDEEKALEEIAILNEKCTKITSTFTDCPAGSFDNHKMESAIADMIDESDKYFDLLKNERELKAKIKAKIDTLKSPFNRILYKRFIFLREIHEIAKEMNYSYRWTQKIINKSIYKYSQIKEDV